MQALVADEVRDYLVGKGCIQQYVSAPTATGFGITFAWPLAATSTTGESGAASSGAQAGPPPGRVLHPRTSCTCPPGFLLMPALAWARLSPIGAHESIPLTSRLLRARGSSSAVPRGSLPSSWHLLAPGASPSNSAVEPR